MRRLHQQWPIDSGTRGWLAALGAALVLLALLALFDAEVARLVLGLPAPVPLLFGWITLLGESAYVLIPALVVALVAAVAMLFDVTPLLRRGLRQLAALSSFVFAGVGLPGLLTAVVKRLVGRARPELLEASGPFDFRTMNWLDWLYQSFPSGHATTGFALCFTVSFLLPRTFPWMLTLATLIAVSRVVVGAHFASDIVGGAVVGTLGAYLVRNIFLWRGWLFEVRDDGAIARKPADALMHLFRWRA